MDLGIRLGSGHRQSRDLPVEGKKLVIRRPIKKNNTRSGDQKNKLYFEALICVCYVLQLKIIVHFG